jgi:pimeloyl-ACP methyl ester carboxylesterase
MVPSAHLVQNRDVWLRRASGALGVSLGALALVSTGYQLWSEARDRRRYAPPGRLVDVGGRRMHIRCAGEGTPPVVIVPSLGAYSVAWAAVQDALSAHTTVCVYDRPGLGWSDPAPGWPTATGMARDLHGLLEAAGIAPPFVLAGHSIGGLVTRVFTHMYPGEVAGLALVDSSHPEQEGRLAPAWPQDYRGGKLMEAGLAFAQPLGLRRMLRTIREGAPEDAREAFALSSRKRRAGVKELLTINAVCRQTGRLAGDLGDLPLAVISSSERDPQYPDGTRMQRARSRFYRGWIQLQRELATLSTDTVHVVAAHSGHHLNRDDPDLVVKTIAELVRRAGGGTRQ